MKKNNTPHAAIVVGSILRVRRELVRVIKEKAVTGSNLTFEQADLLLDLHGIRYLGFAEPESEDDGYVTFENLKKTLGHSQALLSLKISDLEEMGFVEIVRLKDIARSDKRARIDSKKKSLRITAEGTKAILPVYNRFCLCCENLLADISAADQAALFRLNETILKRCR